MTFPTPSLRVSRGKHVVGKKLLSLYNKSDYAQLRSADANTRAIANQLPEKLIPPLAKSPLGGKERKHFSVCIIGGGCAGLYAAKLLADLEKKSFDHLVTFDIDILEASERVGGRAYTHHFPKDDNCKHNYYDMGAMRIPDIASMKPTIDLIKELQEEGAPISLETYTYDNGHVSNMYYYTPYKNGTSPDDGPFSERMKWLLNHYGFSAAKTESALTEAFDSYFGDTQYNFDSYSCRAWMMTTFPDLEDPKKTEPPLPPALNYEQTQVGEMLETSSGLLDQALTEMMIDYSDFQAAKKAQWFRVEGKMNDHDQTLTGMSALTDALQAYIRAKKGLQVQTGSPVVGMAQDPYDSTIAVTWGKTDSAQQTKKYDYVICTTSLGCLQRMDLSGLNLTHEVLTGIRSLAYDRATKVAIKFTDRWWYDLNGNQSGGVSSTDLPVSNVVYPSWDDGDDKQNYILMASYSWAQDATRMSALVKDYPDAEVKDLDDPLLTLCLKNLVKLFNDPNVTYETISKKYISHHAWSWSRDPWTAGAFALFGPGQFEKIYWQNFSSPVVKDDRLLIAGEALSVHHAWISGALDSVYYKILQWTYSEFGAQGAAQLKELGHGGKRGQLPAEVDETHLYWSVRLNREHIPGEWEGKETA